ncbi:hypothetical protein MHYP_G00103290 [Metynnis hypsauchen]
MYMRSLCEELHVEAPEEVTEGETADLTCNTTCSLTDPTFIWYKDGCPLTTKTIKNNQLHLQTVSSEDAGSYSCAVRGSQHLHSTAHRLRVRRMSLSAVWIAVGGGSFVCLLLTVFVCICRMKKRAAGTDHSETNQDVLFTTVTPSTSRPADSADSGAASAHTTVMVENDGVTSTDQQEEPLYTSVTFLHPPATTGSLKLYRRLYEVLYSGTELCRFCSALGEGGNCCISIRESGELEFITRVIDVLNSQQLLSNETINNELHPLGNVQLYIQHSLDGGL